ncbi:GNAT family N-acetyltransferase [Bernardetia sp.]|uniref:GNAT family N-acetyltransferase n=1 Tax=Bernardetia sp. TaxID=1937974 RepID=UPI0025C17B72|nr:GNAT family N-acetyltransferase [Bernardetia sp.]
MIEHLNWDSDFFGYKIGRIHLTTTTNIQKVFHIVQQSEYKLIYLVVSESVHNEKLKKELESHEIYLVDEKITFSQNVPITTSCNDNLDNIRLFLQKQVHPKLIDLSLQSGIYSRFKIDKNFINQEYEKLYTAWIENSVGGKIADRVIVAYQENEIVGLLTLAFKDSFSDIGVLAVDEHCRGQKIGHKLVKKAILETQEQAIRKVKVVTQKVNKQACNFYLKQNFDIEKIDYIYHIWK